MVKPKVNKGEPLAKEDCLAIGKQALASFTRDELQDYADEVIKKARTYEDVRGQAAIYRALDELNNERLNSLFNDCKISANNIAKVDELNRMIKNGTDVRQLLVPRGKANQANNVWESQRAAKGKLAGAFFSEDFTSEEMDFAFDKKNKADIVAALNDEPASDTAKKVAKQIKEKYIPTRNAELIRSDALPVQYISDYHYLDHMHDPSALINGNRNFLQRAWNIIKGEGDAQKLDAKKAWVNFIKPKLDPENPLSSGNFFDAEGNLLEEKLEKVLGNIFDNITLNDSSTTASIVVNDLAAIKNKRLMKLQFKDWRTFSEYNDRYGHGDLMGALMADIQGSGSRIGTADLMGSSPKTALLDLKETQKEVGLPGRFKSLGRYNTTNDHIFNSLIGANQNSVSPTFSNFMANIRSLTSVTRLVKIGVVSTPDIAHGVSLLGRYGAGGFKDWGYYLSNLWNNPIGGMVFSDRQKIAKQFKLMVDSHLGYVARMIDANNTGQFVNRITSKVFKALLLEGLDKGNKVSTLHLLSNILAENSKYSWENLSKDFRTQLQNHNLTPDEWNLLRSKTKGKLFTLDNVNAITPEELRSLNSNAPLLNRHADLYRKVYAMFDNAAQQVVLTPTAWSKAMLQGGSIAGTGWGEFVRAIGQFKMYPVDYIDRVWMQGLSNADGKIPKLAFAVRLIAATLPLSFLSVWFDYAAQGKTMPDYDLMTPSQRLRLATSLIAPGMGIALGLLDKRNQNKNLAWALLRSPSTDLIGDSLSSLLSLMSGEKDNAFKELKNTSRDILPIDTIPGISPYLREALGDKPYLQPGQDQRFGA